MEKQTKKQAGIIHILALFIIIIGIGVGVFLIQQRTQLKSKATLEGVDFSLQPSQIDAVPNQPFSLNIFANTKDLSVAAVKIHISFDPNQVEVKVVAQTAALPIVLEPGSINSNEATITMGVNPENVFKGSATIATLTVVPKANFTATTIQFTDQTMVGALDHVGNAVGSLNSAAISLLTPTVTSTPTTSSIPSLSPSLSPSPYSYTSSSPKPSTGNSGYSQPPRSTSSPYPAPATTSTTTQQKSTQTQPNTPAVKQPVPTEQLNAFQKLQQRNAPQPSVLIIKRAEPSPEASNLTPEQISQIPVLGRLIDSVLQFNIRIINFVSNLFNR